MEKPSVKEVKRSWRGRERENKILGWIFLPSRTDIEARPKSNLKKSHKMPPGFFSFSVVLLRNEEGDINPHKQTCIFRDACICWLWGAGWPMWSSSWAAQVLVLWLCQYEQCPAAAGHKPQELLRQTLHSHLPVLPGPEQAWALLSSCYLFCSPGPLSSPSHVPCSSWPSEECPAPYRTQPLLSWEQLARVAAGADRHHHNSFNPTLFYQQAVLPRHPKTTRTMLTKVHCIHSRNLFYRLSLTVQYTNVFFHTIWRYANMLLFCYPTDLIVFSGVCRNWFCQHWQWSYTQ